ncbi:MAG: hypothetical protein ACE367_14380 [Acidimicrobiales bacterium]
MSLLTAEPEIANRHIRRAFESNMFVVVVAALIASALGLALFDEPARVDIAFSNSTVYDMTISTRAADDEAWLPLGTIGRGTERSIALVLDQGDDWVFRFQSQGVVAADIEMGRAALEADGWRVVVPAAVEQDLIDQGASPSPGG